MKSRGMVIIGALLRKINGTGIMKIVTEYKCDAAQEWVRFADWKEWQMLNDYEILSELD